MAPYLAYLDDFVMTISDNDQEISVADAENISTKCLPITGKKRKRKLKEDSALKICPDEQPKMPSKRIVAGKARVAGPVDDTVLRDDHDPTWMARGEDDGAMDSDFEFQVGDVDNGIIDNFDGWGLGRSNVTEKSRGDKKGVDIDQLIARRKGFVRRALKEAIPDDDECSEGGEGEIPLSSTSYGDLEEEEDETLAEDGFGMDIRDAEEESDDLGPFEEPEGLDSECDDESVAEPMPYPDDEDPGGSSGNDREESARRKAFFAPEETADNSTIKSKSLISFQNMSLSRPILRGLASVGFSEPTPIQSKAIPVALLGKDVVGGAVTGSGKTGAFIIPILERLLYRPRKVPTSRVAILMPTRELAVQCFNVAKKLASFTDVTFCQMVGGFSLREQEAVLKSRPDVIIATPGRFIDHMRNSASFTVDTLEILVLDEADRMLEDGFADELNEILTTIPKSRQTMLFSATMTDRVDKLVRVGLNRPVRLMVDSKMQTVETLIQEFVRLRPGREGKRLACLLYLCENVFTEKVIVFFRQKREAHRVRIILGLCGLKVTELHGDMTQEQRISSIESFRATQMTHLLATDLASRGLDIRAVSTVLNYEPPQSYAIYLHRVGRTARAGLPGRACTFASERDRKLVREIVRTAKSQGARVVSRVLDNELVDHCEKRINALEGEVDVILGMEKEEKAIVDAERDVRRGENLMEFTKEIAGRPKRTWFLGEEDKRKSKEKGARELNCNRGGDKREKEKKAKLSGKARKKLDDRRERVEGKVWRKGKGQCTGTSKMNKGKAKKQGSKRELSAKQRLEKGGGKRT